MTQKYKKNNSPAIQNGIFSSFPDVSQPNLSDFPDVLQPDFSCFPGVLQPDFSDFPNVFWLRYGGNIFGVSKKYGRPHHRGRPFFCSVEKYWGTGTKT